MKRLMILALALLPVLAAVSSVASTPVIVPEIRGLYYGGKVHFVCKGNASNSTYANKIVHCQEALSTSNWKFDLNSTPTATVALPSNVQGYWDGGVAIMDDKIFYSITLMIGSSPSTAVPYLYCAVFDLVGGSFYSPIQQVCKLTDSASFVHSALTVFGDKVFIITNSTTATSTDGKSWTIQQYPILTASDKLAPVDAITFSPMGDSSANIMLICADSTNHYEGGVYSAIWDGIWGDPTAKIKFDSKGMYYGQLFGGTVKPPSSGNGSSYHAGHTNACIQAFINQDIGSGCVRYEYDLTTQSWNQDSHTSESNASYGFYGFTSYLDECATAGDKRCIQRQYIGINGLDSSMNWHSWAFYSDAMVPQYEDTEYGYGWQGIPTATSEGTEQENQKLRNYWSLIGVILGPPPFAVNDMTDDYALHNLSNVIYGSETDSKVSETQTTENTVMLGSDAKIKIGVKDKWGAAVNLDHGFKWSWQNEHKNNTSTITGYHFKYGTAGEDGGTVAENWGRHGWVLFNSPNMVSQWYKLYAYDYIVDGTSGHYLNQDIQTVQAVGMVLQSVGFDLGEPGGSLDEIPGLCTGIQPFPYSQQLNGWKEMNWEDPDAPWYIKFGTGTGGGTPVTPLHQGTPGGINYTTGTETVDSNGTTTGTDVNAGFKYSEGTDLNGFSLNLTAGYDCKVSSNTEVTTGGTSDILCDLEMPYTSCGDPGCVSVLQVQPYWLVATDAMAPWIPSGYSGQLPWCLTWRVDKFTNADYEEIGPWGELPDDSTADIGNGTVTETGAETELAKDKWDSFSLSGGSLEWLGEGGAMKPVPLTAATFDTASGAEVRVGGYILKTDLALGRWTKHGEVLRYKSREKSGPPEWTLELNFAKKSWNINAKKLVLHDKIPAAKRHIRVELVLNQKYTVYGDILYKARVKWQHSEPALDADRFSLTDYYGSFDTASGEGEVDLEGTLPSSIGNFGDTTFVFNGVPHHIPLLSVADFQSAMDSGKDIVYKEDGLVVRVDFGKKKWSATFKKDRVKREMAPKWGKSKIEVRVGGELLYSKVVQINNFKSKLKL